MPSITRRSFLASSAAVASLALANGFPGAQVIRAQGVASYDLVDFGPITNGVRVPEASRLFHGYVSGITANGLTFGGVAVSEEKYSPAYWDRKGTLKRLKSGKYGGYVKAMNAGGTAVGVQFASIDGNDTNQIDRATAWIDGEPVELPLPEPELDYLAAAGDPSGISDAGEIVGTGNGHVLHWIDNSPTVLIPPSGARVNSILINPRGTIGLSMSRPDVDDGLERVARIDSLGEGIVYFDPPTGTESFGHEAIEISSNGDILAAVWAKDVYFGVIYGAEKTTPIDFRETGGSFQPFAFNSKHQVVGRWQATSLDAYTPVIWSGDQPVELATLIPASSTLQMISALGINDDGLIAGWAKDDTPNVHPVLLIPAT